MDYFYKQELCHIRFAQSSNSQTERPLYSNYDRYPHCYKNAGGKFIFKEVADFVLKLLLLPLSNAVVERVFSILNLVKTKIRNVLPSP